jgi:glycosyltransferase involved in cell wall biosynthesis
MSGARRHIMMTTDAVGGVWTYVVMLTRALVSRGHRVTLVSLGPAPTDAQCRELAAGVDLIVSDLALEWMDPAGEDRLRAAEALLSIAHTRRPDLIHLNSFREGAIAWPAPAIVVAHSCVMTWWQACRGCLPNEPRWLSYRANVDAGLRAVDAWVAPTTAFRDVVQDLYAPPTQGIPIHNGVELPEGRELLPKRDVILASGRVWDPAKNLSEVVSAARDVCWPIEVAGPIAAPRGEAVVNSDNVRLLGQLPRAQLLRRMGHAAIYVAPARYEPFGLGVLEAAREGCALVLSEIPSMRELWDGAALFVRPDDTAQLCDTLNRLTRDSVFRRELQKLAQVCARKYTIAATEGRYTELYDTLLGRIISGAAHREARA